MSKPLQPWARTAIQRLITEGRGIVTCAHWLKADLDPGLLSWRARPAGPWQRVHPGVYATHSGQLTPDERLLAAHAYCGDGSMVTADGALIHLSLFDQRLPERLVFLVPHERRRKSLADLEVERTRFLPTASTGLVVPAAPIARAIVDACRRTDSQDRVRHLVGLAIQRRKATVTELRDALAQAPHRGTSLLREAIGGAEDGVRGAEEARVRDLCLAHGITQVQWNVHLYDPATGDWVAYVDGWLRGRYLETQSRKYHLYRSGRWEADQERMTRLGTYDAIPILATKAAVTKDPSAVLAALRRALDDPAPRSPLVVGKAPEWWGHRAA